MLIYDDEPLNCEINYRSVKGVNVVQSFINGELFDESINIHGKWYDFDSEAGEVNMDYAEEIH